MPTNDPSPTLLQSGKRKSDLAQKRAENLKANLIRRKQQTKARNALPESDKAQRT